MENKEPIHTVKGTHPVMMMLFFGTIMAVLVASGSYVSKQKSTARELEASVENHVTLLSFIR